MKKKIDSFRHFTKEIGKGMHVEWKETKEIPSLLLKREYKKAGAQVVDICKMAGLGIVWVLPGGAVITAFIVKFSHKARPSAFQSEKKPETMEGSG
ncbi:hypothetical protein ACM66Z_08400 [Sulfurovum sp. ST-21]|uniref:Uncharacterized protein n=1 Tax=Sulfurovum indicum TaxID=2779528 RepID=A0A7M1S2M3_9BACT|nr:hypothetical protein [Sulfurovum indicum]QOR61454.1 hypothetical protein IMZ28_08400 [Sulfurovum indicum]